MQKTGEAIWLLPRSNSFMRGARAISCELPVTSRRASPGTPSRTAGAKISNPSAKAVLIDFVEGWKALFGEEKPSNRIEWDMEYRKQEFIHACETQNAEGGCYKEGLIEKALGHIESAKRLFARACDLKL